jgi:nucleoid-associated protein YgaU
VAAAKGSHRVGKGDTLYSLARRYYGDGKRFRDIAEANGLDPADPLPVGKELRIP